MVMGRSLPVAESRQITTTIALEAGVGVWRDLMVYARMPLVLSDTRLLQAPSGDS